MARHRAIHVDDAARSGDPGVDGLGLGLEPHRARTGDIHRQALAGRHFGVAAARDIDIHIRRIEIAEAALARFSTEENRDFDGLDPEVRRLFLGLAWPGNVRQLLNVIRNVVVLNDGGRVTPDMLPPELVRAAPDPDGPDGPEAMVPGPTAVQLVGLTLAEIEQLVIEATLARFGGSVPRAARVLDVSPSTLYRKLDSWRSR